MKGTIQSSAVLLPLALSLVAAKNNPPPPKTQGGNQVQTTYEFKNDKFGNGDVINLSSGTGIQGGNTKGRRHLEDLEFELWARAASAAPKNNPPPPKTQGGNQVQTTYEFKNDKFGNGDVINLGSSNQVQGGGTKGRRSIDELDLYIRDLEQQILYGRAAEAYPFMNGGKSSGGDSKTGGGNQVTNKNNMNGANIGAGSQVSMGNQNQQKGGNVQGGFGGANAGIGGGAQGISPSMNMPMPFPPLAKRGFFDDDGEFLDDLNVGSSFIQKGPNQFSISHSTVQQGGNVKGQDGEANTADGADASNLALSRRWLEIREADPFMDGGPSNAGSSKSNGGNKVDNKNNMNGAKIGPGSQVSMGNQNQQKGGNVVGGDGGQNSGRGGSGGGIAPSMSMPMPFPPLRRDVEYLYAREAEPFMNGGSSNGGDSKSHGGNEVKNQNNMNGVKAGPGAQISMGNQNSQKGGNVQGGSGGANAGIGGGAQGISPSMSMPMPFPPLSRRDAEIEDILARAAEADLDDIYFELFARDAYADPEAEAEPEEFDLYERDVFFFDSEYDY